MGCKGQKRAYGSGEPATEYLREPIGLDTKSPRFTWEYKGSEKNLFGFPFGNPYRDLAG